MEVGIVGLGKMGGAMAQRLVAGGHRVVGHDLDPASLAELTAAGGEAAAGLDALAAALSPPRAVWLMVPAGPVVDRVLGMLAPHLAAGDVVVDGGNSHYPDSQRRAAALAADGVAFLDVGTSGGVWGLAEGYCLMVGGEAAAVERLRPAFETLAPAADRGWAHVGPSGAGHYVKMVHNGIEYGLMQAYAEGFALLDHKEDLALDLPQIAELWRHGSVVRSWLLDLATRALAADPDLSEVAPWVADSGEGRWTVEEAVELATSTPVIALALMARFRSRDTESFSDRLLAALRREFGGHAVLAAADGDDDPAPPPAEPPPR